MPGTRRTWRPTPRTCRDRARSGWAPTGSTTTSSTMRRRPTRAPTDRARTFPTADLGRGSFGSQGIDAACLHGKQLFLVSGTQFVRYTLTGQSVPDFVDAGYPKSARSSSMRSWSSAARSTCSRATGTGAWARRRNWTRLVELKPIEGNWGNLPYRFRAGLDGAGSTLDALYLFSGERYVRYPADGAGRRPGRDAVRAQERQVRDHPADHGHCGHAQPAAARRRRRPRCSPPPPRRRTRPRRSTRGARASTVIRVRPDRVDEAQLPVGSHLDFDSANGIYYWEAFFHAPLLIANTLNAGQQFAEAMRWYEYIFDPTQAGTPWRFLPFRAVDVDALLDTCRDAFGVLGGASTAWHPRSGFPGSSTASESSARCSRRSARPGTTSRPCSTTRCRSSSVISRTTWPQPREPWPGAPA